MTRVKGEPSPIKQHQDDSISIYLVGGTIKTTLPDGKSTVTKSKSGDAVFGQRGSADVVQSALGG